MANPVVAIAGGSIASGVMGASASKKAANTAARSADRAADMQQQQYQQVRADNMPYMQAGYNSLPMLSRMTTPSNMRTPVTRTTTTRTVPGTRAPTSGPVSVTANALRGSSDLGRALLGFAALQGHDLSRTNGGTGGGSRTVTTTRTTGGERGLAPELRDPNKYNLDPLYRGYSSDVRPETFRVDRDAGKFADKMGEFEESPGYRYRLEEGERALNRHNAATGGFFSAGAAQDLMRHNQGMAADEYDDWWRRRYSMLEGDWQRDRMDNSFNLGLSQLSDDLKFRDYTNNMLRQQQSYDRAYGTWRDNVNDQFRLAGLGQAAAAGTAAAGSAAAANSGTALMAGGRAAAEGHLNSANALTGTMDNLFGLYGAYRGGAFGSTPGPIIGKGSTWGWG